MFLKCELFYPLIETYFPLQLYTENIRDASDSYYYNNMSPERVKSKRESMRNVERFLYVNTIAAENLNKIVANKLLVLLLNFL